MNLRTSFTFSLVFVVWVVTCVFAFTTYEHRPCVVVPPGAGTEDCAQTGCHLLIDDDEGGDVNVYWVRSFGKEYRKCSLYEYYYLDCEEQAPSSSLCSIWYRYDDEQDCNNDSPDTVDHLGGLYHTGTSGAPSCKKYSWQ